jgi:HSP20 family protein
MKLVRWNRPFSYVPSMFEDDDFFNWPSISGDTGLNIYETEEDVVVEAAVPGISEDKVDVSIEGNILTISADQEETEEEKSEKKVVYKSTRKTTFNYSTSLPRTVEGDKANAEVENGVITVRIPKAETEKRKKIEVKKKGK